MNLDFQRFLETGRFGEIELGCSRNDVERILGEPEAESTSKKPLLWKYGNVQLAFNNGVSLILVTFLEDDWHPAIRPVTWTPQTAMPLDSFKQVLDEKGISMVSDPELTFDEQRNFFIGAARVSTLFVDDLLNKMALSRKLRKTIK